MIPSDNGFASSVCPTRVRSESTIPSRVKRLRLGLKVTLVGLGIVFILAAWGAALAHQVLSVRAHLEQAIELVPRLVSEIGEGNQVEAHLTVESIHTHTSAARSKTTGPLWQSATVIPFIGPNFSAVREVAMSSEEITTGAVMPLVENYDALNWQTVSPQNGRIDTAKLQGASPYISAAASTVRLSHQRLASIDRTNLVRQIGEPVESATDRLEELAVVLDTAASAAHLLPAMLGADEPRHYLVLVQNSAEARATGGIPGALAVLSANDGKIVLEEQSSASALGPFQPSIEVDPEQTSLYTQRLGTQMQNVNLTPNFPTAASTAKQMWEERHPSETVDGVLALDPVVLRNLIGASGPVDVSDPEVLSLIEATSLPKSLTKDNVVSTLLSEVYKEIEDPAAQDAYFSAVAGQVFATFTGGKGDGTQLVKALASSVQEHRLYLWSAQPNEQSMIATTPLAGSVEGSQAKGASFGVYFNDGTGAKMDYYASRTARLVQTCHGDEYSSYIVRLRVTNNAPSDAAAVLPSYVTGHGVYGVEPGHIRTNYVFYGPAQAFVETASLNGRLVPIGAGKHGQRPVGTVTLELAPGESAELDVVFSRVVRDSDPELQVTPGLEANAEVVLPAERTACQ